MRGRWVLATEGGVRRVETAFDVYAFAVACGIAVAVRSVGRPLTRSPEVDAFIRAAALVLPALLLVTLVAGLVT